MSQDFPLKPTRSRTILAVFTATALAATLLVAALPSLRFAYVAPSVRAALESAAALIAILCAYLMLGRFLRHRGMFGLLLFLSLAAVALGNLAGAVLLTLPPTDAGRVFAGGI